MPDLAVKSTPVTSGENLLSLVGHFFFLKLKDGNRDYMYVFSALCSKQARGPLVPANIFVWLPGDLITNALIILSGIYNLHDVYEL